MDAFQSAVEHHQAGRLEQAEFLYREVLRTQPRHADALHLLGVIAHQKGMSAQAVRLIEEALAIYPDAPAYYTNLAEAYRALGNFDQAEIQCRHALRLQQDSAEARNNLGLVLQHQGKSEEAIALFEKAIELKPHWALPYFNLGGLFHKLGRHYDAVAIYREGLNLCGAAPQLQGSLGQVLLELGQAAEALAHCQEAVRLQPDHPLALTFLGNALAALERRTEARSCYQRALERAPALAPALHKLGQLAADEGNYDEALARLSEAVRLEPGNALFQRGLANVLYESDRADEAIARYRLLLERHPDDAEAHNSLGYLLQDAGAMPEALAEYRHAVRLKPAYADAHLNRGLLLSETGEKEEALAAFRAALLHEPYHPEALGGLALHLRDRLPAEDLARAERLLALGRIPGKRRAVLLYGLAHVMDGRSDYARAFEYARQANQYFLDEARQRRQSYDPAEHHDYVSQIMDAYPQAHFQRVRGWGLGSEVPVFIVGLPRSGTSLAEQILASHPRVFGAGELVHMRSLYRSLPERTGSQAPGIACIGRLEPALVQQLASEYLEQLRRAPPASPPVAEAPPVADAPGSPERIVDKMPDNYLMLGLIATLLPKARIIHMRRDVRDVGLSCWLTHFRHIRWACDLTHIAARIEEYQRLMEHWRRVLPAPMLEMDYEEIVADLEPAARRLVAWCGLEWDPACLEFHKTRRVVRTASMVQVRQPLYQKSVGRWRKYQQWLTPLVQALS